MHSQRLDTEANKNKLLTMLEQTAAVNFDVIVLPELWATGFYPAEAVNFAHDADNLQKFLSELARRHNAYVVGGSVVSGRGDAVYNTCFCFNRQGELLSAYDKIHLFSPTGEDKYFAHGDKINLFDIEGITCGTAICYDLRFPELMREMSAQEAKIIFLPAQWPKLRLNHWRILNQARAVENQIFLAAANGAGKSLAGHSMLVSPWGDILTEGGEAEGVFTATINPDDLVSAREKINVWRDRRL